VKATKDYYWSVSDHSIAKEMKSQWIMSGGGLKMPRTVKAMKEMGWHSYWVRDEDA
jgi:hypothetical protein